MLSARSCPQRTRGSVRRYDHDGLTRSSRASLVPFSSANPLAASADRGSAEEGLHIELFRSVGGPPRAWDRQQSRSGTAVRRRHMDPTPPIDQRVRSLWSSPAWGALRAVGFSQTYPPAVSLFEQGSPVEAIGVVEEGLVKLLRWEHRGGCHTRGAHCPDERPTQPECGTCRHSAQRRLE